MKTLTAMLLATTTIAASLAAGISTAEAATQMRCSHQLPPAHHIAKVVDRWAAEVEKLSDGELDVQVFGADSLIKANDNILAVAKGDIGDQDLVSGGRLELHLGRFGRLRARGAHHRSASGFLGRCLF